MGSASSVPANYEKEARGITVMLIVLTTVGIISRMLSRSLQRANISVDDYLVVLSYFANLGLLITILLEISHGGVSLPRMATMTKADKLYLKHVTTALAFLYTFAIIIVKISVLFMYRRIFTLNEKWFRIGWWANFILLVPCYTVAAFTLTALQVSNNQKFGANNISKHTAFALGSVNAVSDTLVLLLPVAMVWRLMLPIREKLTIISIFSLGIVATSISIMRVVRFHIKREEKWNAAYSFYNDIMTSSSETSVALMCVCLMVVKPLLRKTREIAISSATGLTQLLSLGSNGGSKAGRSNSAQSDNVSLHSRKTNDGITKIYQYNIESNSLRPSSSQRDIELEHIHHGIANEV